MKEMFRTLATILVFGITQAAAASDLETKCTDSTMGAFSLEVDTHGMITAGSLGLIYKGYRKCDLTTENTRIIKEFGESVLKSDCVGSAKLLYDHVDKTLYAIEPEQNRKIAVASCSSFAQDAHPESLIFQLDALARGDLDDTTYAELERKAASQLRDDAKNRCQSSGRTGHVRTMSALQTSQSSDHFHKFGSVHVESIFMCD